MASMTITTPFIGTSSSNRSSHNRRMCCGEGRQIIGRCGAEGEEQNIRRDMVLAAAAAAACSAASACGVAIADQPKPGTPDAKKKYAPICVTMPTASICHK